MNIKTHLCATTLAVALAVIPWSHEEATAAEKPAANPTGTWKVRTSTGATQSKPGSERTLKLKWEGGKLSGTFSKVSLVNGKPIVKERPIQDAKLQGNELSFTVTFPVEAGEGPDVTTKYRGQISGETIKGKLESEWMGNTTKRDWEAKRSKE